MAEKKSREVWLAEKVAKARASVAAGRVFTHEEAQQRMADHIAGKRDKAA